MSALVHRLGWSLRLQQRYGIHYAALYVAGLWLVVGALAPVAWRPALLRYVLFLDVAIFGLFFLPALAFLERDERTLPALRASPLGSSRYLGAGALALLVPSLAIGLVVAAAARTSVASWPLLAASLGLITAINLLGGFAAASRFPSIQSFFMPAGFLLVAFQLPALEPFLEGPQPWLWLTPTHGAWRLLGAGLGAQAMSAGQLAAAAGHALLAIALLWPLAVRAVDRLGAPPGAPRRLVRASAPRAAPAPRGWLAALVQLDARIVSRNSMYAFLFLALGLLYAVVRLALPSAEAALMPWIDLRAQRPLVWTFFGVLYIPALIGSLVGLMLLDERDEGALLAIRATPLTLKRFLGYRVAVAMGLSVLYAYLGLAVFHPTGVSLLAFAPTAVLAALETPLAALVIAALARNKVEGLALTKALGAPFIASVVAWFVPFPWRWLMLIVPTYWPAQALWWAAEGRALGPVVAFAAVGAAYHVALIVPLWRRFVRRVG